MKPTYHHLSLAKKRQAGPKHWYFESPGGEGRDMRDITELTKLEDTGAGFSCERKDFIAGSAYGTQILQKLGYLLKKKDRNQIYYLFSRLYINVPR